MMYSFWIWICMSFFTAFIIRDSHAEDLDRCEEEGKLILEFRPTFLKVHTMHCKYVFGSAWSKCEDDQGDQMICSKNAQKMAKNARHSAHQHFTRKCPKCPIVSLFPAPYPPKMPTFMPKQKIHKKFYPIFCPKSSFLE